MSMGPYLRKPLAGTEQYLEEPSQILDQHVPYSVSKCISKCSWYVTGRIVTLGSVFGKLSRHNVAAMSNQSIFPSQHFRSGFG